MMAKSEPTLVLTRASRQVTAVVVGDLGTFFSLGNIMPVCFFPLDSPWRRQRSTQAALVWQNSDRLRDMLPQQLAVTISGWGKTYFKIQVFLNSLSWKCHASKLCFHRFSAPLLLGGKRFFFFFPNFYQFHHIPTRSEVKVYMFDCIGYETFNFCQTFCFDSHKTHNRLLISWHITPCKIDGTEAAFFTASLLQRSI